MIVHPPALSDAQLTRDRSVRAVRRPGTDLRRSQFGNRAGGRQSATSLRPRRRRPICRSSFAPGASATIPRRSSATSALAQRVQVGRSARSRRALSGLAASDGGQFRHQGHDHRQPADAQSGERRRAASAQGRDHDLHAAGHAPPTRRRCSMPTQVRAQTTAAGPDGRDHADGREVRDRGARFRRSPTTAFPRHRRAIKSGKINVVVMADSDIFDDRFWVRVQNVLGRQDRRALRRQWRLRAERGGESHRIGRSHLPAHARRQATGPSPSCATCRRRRRPSSRRRNRRCRQRLTDTQQRLRELEQGGGDGGRQDCGPEPRTTGRDRALQAPADRHPHPAARRAAQSAQGHRCAGRAPRLRQHRAGAAARGDLRHRCWRRCAGAAARARWRCEDDDGDRHFPPIPAAAT